MAEKDEKTPEPEKIEAPKTSRKVKLRFAGQLDHGDSTGRLTYEDRVILERGEVVEVSPADARGIQKAFGDRYEIEEVK